MKSLKIFVLGANASGTTSIVDRYVYDSFSERTLQTIGIDYRCTRKGDYIHKFFVSSGIFCQMASSYVKTCDFFVFVYDITDRDSFLKLEMYYEKIMGKVEKRPKIFLVGNKNDLEIRRQVSANEGIEFAIKYGMIFYEISAKTGGGIDELVDEIRFLYDTKLFYKDDIKSSEWGWFNLFSCCCARTKTEK